MKIFMRLSVGLFVAGLVLLLFVFVLGRSPKEIGQRQGVTPGNNTAAERDLGASQPGIVPEVSKPAHESQPASR